MIRLAVIGQGYVGLPLAIEFARFYPAIGFDIDAVLVDKLNAGKDTRHGVTKEEIAAALQRARDSKFTRGYRASSNYDDLKYANIFIITVPTPVDRFHAPDLTALLDASEKVGQVMEKGSIVIYESTVYPGCTEEECIPVLEASSGLSFNIDFFVGYSPERIVPGDLQNTLTKIVKVTSGSTPEVAEIIDQLYKKIIEAGTYKAPSIKVAEAAKSIENAQRDINISFVNELALIFDRLEIDTREVIEAAATKFNFIKFQPGLVGGHCISVDPYYLAYKAMQVGYHPAVILSGRRVNDSMASFIAGKVVKLMISKVIELRGASVLILGVTFKENCRDIRNSKVIDLYHELRSFGLQVEIYDPWADTLEVQSVYEIAPLDKLSENKRYDAVVAAVAHEEFIAMDLSGIRKENSVVFDVKACLNRDSVDGRL